MKTLTICGLFGRKRIVSKHSHGIAFREYLLSLPMNERRLAVKDPVVRAKYEQRPLTNE